ncbi:MAG: peroxiredoxin [Candidatus Marinimicrobia bacterium]|nr:peroxiredoxin [Candidatus Neomarinimicrobiota bacterium]MBT3676444.1 peroxiredoxin [Candidatus Neomarinimicrobiota bacterium]MBT3762640.1 peroxiredoxin [Candidatus Neomarinimicrobiota bacterium]MBT4068472.1 peroxiredoxin [Candidatus Neomarinimicrobiota bacterium]MBT4270703.1 peroxiredoxin [Candidatus Neomarinimicrobiota bacterium]
MKEACGFRNAFSEYEKENITVFGISYDSPKALSAFKKKFNLPFTLLSDKGKKVSKAYGTKGRFWASRVTFVLDNKGRIEKIYKKMNVNTHAGEILDDILGKE